MTVVVQSGDVVFVSGSSRGIGAALVRHFAARGCRVVVNCRASLSAGEEVTDEIRRRHGNHMALFVPGDLAREDDVVRLFDTAKGQFGGIDALINNAGINRDGPLRNMTTEDWDSVHGAVLRSAFLCSREFARRYQGHRGVILSLASGSAVHGRINGANYCSAKAGVLNLTKDLALELAPRIRANALALGLVDTDEVLDRYDLRTPENRSRAEARIPLGRLGTVDDVVDAADFLLFRAPYLTGQTLFLNGGLFLP